MIEELYIRDFRLFKDQRILLGKYVTAFSGANATGKSTLLGLLGNSCELKAKDGRPLISNQFRAEFSDLFNADPIFDPPDQNKYEVIINRHDGTEDKRDFRISWQDGGKRFRLIPKGETSEGKKTEAKMSYPVLYLGLSRLFPVGEADDSGVKQKSIKWSDEDKEWYVNEYQRILSMSDQIRSVDSYSIKETSHKHGVGVTTENYGMLANSAGQDNLGQILLAILSFKVLKQNNPNSWDGGLLLIDEIDATLHPIAQNRLCELLISECKSTGIQVVFTTHSLSLLEMICSKTVRNTENQNSIELYSLSTANGTLDIARNPSYESMHNTLMSMSFAQNHSSVKLFTEDAEARWLIKALVSDEPFWDYVRVLEVNNSCDFILKMFVEDYPYFRESIVVLDGDVKDSEIEKDIPSPMRKESHNLIQLPGKTRPEEVVYSFLNTLDGSDDYWRRAASYDFNRTTLNDHGPFSRDYEKYSDNRMKYKEWFKHHQLIFDRTDLISSYKQANQKAVSKFVAEFRRAYNVAAERVGAPRFLA